MDGGGQSSAASVPYLGSKISLISNVDIRYEGVLYSINTFESTVALQNVKSFGTEGRRKPEIPPNGKTYQYIIFKGKDIKDLTVCTSAPMNMPEDPAVVSVNIPPSTPQAVMPGGQSSVASPMGQRDAPFPNDGGYGGRQGMYGMNPIRGVPYMAQQQRNFVPSYPQQQVDMSGMRADMSAMRGAPHGNAAFGYGGRFPQKARGYSQHEMDPTVGGGVPSRGGARFGAGRGRGRGGGGPRRIVGELPPQQNQALRKEVSKAFDFDEANAKFNKAEEKAETKKEGEESENTATEKTKGGYNKATSFFDRISCETIDRAAGQETRVDRDKQRQLDTETFGTAATAPRSGRGYRTRAFTRGARRGGAGGFGGRGGGRYVQAYQGASGYGGMGRY